MRLWPYVALFVSGLCWGLGLPFGKLSLRELDPAHMILLRFLLAGAICAPVVLRSRANLRLLKSPTVLAAGGLYAVGFLVQFEGLARSSVTVAALLVGVMPALVAVSAAVTGERIGPVAWGGVAVATLGALLIAGRPGGATPLGVAICLLSLPIFLGWLFAARAAPRDRPVTDVACTFIFVAALVLLPLVVLLHGWPTLHVSPAGWVGLAGQAVLSTVTATIAWQLGAPRVSAAAAGVFINIEPLVGSAIGVLAFHDRPTLALVCGGLLVVAGSLTVVLFERRSPGGATAAQDAPTPA